MYNDRQTTRGGLPAPRKHNRSISHRRTVDDSPLFKKILSGALWGLLANALAGLILSIAFCGIAYAGSDPLTMIFPMALLALLPSNFLGGFVAARRCGESHIACGVTTAAAWTLLSLIGSLCLWKISSSGYTVWQGLLLHGLSVAFCILGAVAGGIKPAPSRKKRRFG